jgi:hypothetical protein
MRMQIKIFVAEKPLSGNATMFDFAACADNCRPQPWRFPIQGSDELVTLVSMNTCCTLYCLLTTVRHGIDTLIFMYMGLIILAATGHTDNF